MWGQKLWVCQMHVITLPEMKQKNWLMAWRKSREKTKEYRCASRHTFRQKRQQRTTHNLKIASNCGALHGVHVHVQTTLRTEDAILFSNRTTWRYNEVGSATCYRQVALRRVSEEQHRLIFVWESLGRRQSQVGFNYGRKRALKIIS